MVESSNYFEQPLDDLSSKVRNLEEKQRVLKDQTLLIGKNLIESKEKNFQRTTEIKKELELIRQDLEKLSSFVELISGEFSKFAKKEDLEILSKQAKMFQPLNFVTKEELESLDLIGKIKKHTSVNIEEKKE